MKMTEISLMSFTESIQICHRSRGIQFAGGGMEDTEEDWTCDCTLFIISVSSVLIGLLLGINGIDVGFLSYQWWWSFCVRRIQ
jgi:hypothetical protein